MKKLIIILGANGIGKSTAAAELMRILPNSAFVDSDSLRMMNPGGNSAELIQIQKANIITVMSNYFRSDMIENVIFPFGIHGHRERMLEEIISSISEKFEVKIFKIVLIVLAFVSVYFLRLAVAENLLEISSSITFI